MTAFIVLAVLVGFYMAWNIGANDVANAMGTSVGSGALTLKKAILVAIIFEFAGAMLVGSHVTGTVRKGIIDPAEIAVVADGEDATAVKSDAAKNLMFGMFAALAAAALWLNVATIMGLPVSTTHSIVGAILGFGLAIAPDSVNWGVVGKIVASWVLSPLFGGIIAFVVFRFLARSVLSKARPGLAAQRVAPALTAFVAAILCLSFVEKVLGKALHNWGLTGSKSLPDLLAFSVALVVGSVTFLVVRVRIRNTSLEAGDADHRYMEKIFIRMQVMTACFVAFAHGANDVANAIAPLATVWEIFSSQTEAGLFAMPGKAEVSWVMLLFGGLGIVVGLATYGYRVIETVGKKITEMNPSRGFAAEFAAATVVLIFSRWIKLPISTTHVLIGAVLGVGLARGMAALNLRLIRSIAVSWVVTLPITAIFTMILFYLTQAVFG